MKKALLLSIKPRFADAIFSGEKLFELRKVKPRIEANDLVLVYVTSPRCSLEGAFKVGSVIEMPPEKLWSRVKDSCALSKTEFLRYYEGKEIGYAISIADAWQLETSRNLADLRSQAIIPPQGYRYLSAEATGTLMGG